MKLPAILFTPVVALSASLSSIFLCADGNAATINKSDGFELKQHCLLHGEEEVIITASGLKIFNPKNNLNIVFSAPFKIVTYYDLKTGLMCEVPITQNNSPYQRAVAIISGMSLADIPMQKAGSSIILGLPASKFTTDATYRKEQIKIARTENHSRRIKYAIYNMFTDMAVPQIQSKFLTRHYGLPYNSKLNGIPGIFEFTTISGHSSMYLETSSCKRVQVSESEFKIPPKLKKVGSSQEVLTGDNPAVILF